MFLIFWDVKNVTRIPTWITSLIIVSLNLLRVSEANEVPMCSLVFRSGFLIRCAILVIILLIIILLIILTGYDNNTFPGTCHPSHWSPLSSSCPQCGCTQTRWQGCQRSASGASGTTPGVGTFVNEREYLELFIIVDHTKFQQGTFVQ